MVGRETVPMNSVSEPPINVTEKGGPSRVTFADVAMKIARDGPMYAVVMLAGILAIKGIATAAESMMGMAMAMLSRSYPSPIQISSENRITRHIGMPILALTAAGAVHFLSACTP